MAMEEISWGQRLFGWETPAAWAALNHQGETNLHNLIGPYPRSPVYGSLSLTTAMLLVGGLRATGPFGGRARFLHLPELAGFVPSLVLVALMAFSTIVHYDESLERVGALLSVFFVRHLYLTRTPG